MAARAAAGGGLITAWEEDGCLRQLANQFTPAWDAGYQAVPVCVSFLHSQMVRECFARYLKLTRHALSDASAIAAATAAGISTSGELVQPLEEALRAAELAAEEAAQGYGGGGAASALEESIAAGGLLLICRNACCWNGSSTSACFMGCLCILVMLIALPVCSSLQTGAPQACCRACMSCRLTW